MSTLRAFKGCDDGGNTECDLALSYDATGLIAIEAGNVTIAGTTYPVSSVAHQLSLDPEKAATLFAMVRQHIGSGLVDLGMYQFNEGDPVDFGATHRMLYQFVRAVIPKGTALVDVSLDCWVAKAAA